MKKESKLWSNFLIVFVVFFKFLLNYKIEETFLLKILPFLILLCILGVLKKNTYEKKQLFRTFIVSVPIFIISLIIKSPNFLFPILIALVSLNREFKEIAKVFGYSILFFTFVTIILNLLGVLPSVNLLRLVDGVYKIRYSLGFPHPNSLMGVIVCSVLCLLYAYDFQMKKIIKYSIIVILFFFVTYSRTSLLMFIIVIFLDFIRKNIFKNIKYNFAPYFDLICFLVLIISTILYSKFNFTELDVLFSYRLSTNNLFIESGYLFNIFPNMSILDTLIIDNYHFSLIIRFGFIGFILYIFYNIFTLKKLSKDINIMIIAMAFSISGLTEGVAMVSSLNVIMTFQMIAFINSNRFINKEKKND